MQIYGRIKSNQSSCFICLGAAGKMEDSGILNVCCDGFQSFEEKKLLRSDVIQHGNSAVLFQGQQQQQGRLFHPDSKTNNGITASIILQRGVPPLNLSPTQHFGITELL